ncbi:MAG: hypothetical protein FWH37_01190 [Candidatus Bathyarchaeota archaeon]|nr:hypothetical protein [Candidatus Termiticorpusculum sp.]
MKSIVIYSSHRNNTAQIALVIAQVANCNLVELTKTFDSSTLSLDEYDLIFLGTGIRGGEPYTELLSFIKKADLGSGKRFVLFMTWAGGGASDKLAYQGVKDALELRGQHLDSDYFTCFGKTFGFVRRGRPNENDVAEAKKWATEKLK